MSKELEEKLKDQLNRWADLLGLKPNFKEQKVNNILEEITRFNYKYKDKDFIKGVYFFLYICDDVDRLSDKMEWDDVFLVFVSNDKIEIICDYEWFKSYFTEKIKNIELFDDYELSLRNFEADTQIYLVHSLKK